MTDEKPSKAPFPRGSPHPHRGGHARAANMSAEERSASASNAAKARWAKHRGEPPPKRRVGSGRLVARVYDLLSAAVEEGVAMGARRADKHADDPLTDRQRERIVDHVRDDVLGAILDRFDIKGEDDDGS